MGHMDKFFSLQNTIPDISEEEARQLADYLVVLDAFARTTYQSIYVIDYHTHSFDYVSENPLLLCGHSAEEVKEMGYDFYYQFVVEEDLDLLYKISNIGFGFYQNIPKEERRLYTITYDLRLKDDSGRMVLVNHKLTPLFLTKDGKLWRSLCVVSLPENQAPGNIKIYKQNENKFWRYEPEGGFWETNEKINLTDREREILCLSIQGLSVNDIAQQIFISADTVKFHRRMIFEKLGVANITEAISFAINNRLL
jgi:DNA-binding CsgD family transcriptional regulator